MPETAVWFNHGLGKKPIPTSGPLPADAGLSTRICAVDHEQAGASKKLFLTRINADLRG
jgi:hypothetical protein